MIGHTLLRTEEAQHVNGDCECPLGGFLSLHPKCENSEDVAIE